MADVDSGNLLQHRMRVIVLEARQLLFANNVCRAGGTGEPSPDHQHLGAIVVHTGSLLFTTHDRGIQLELDNARCYTSIP